MKTFISAVSAATLLLSSLSVAAPLESRDATVTATMIGAAGAQYTFEIPINSKFTPSGNELSISHIKTDAGPCAFIGIDDGVVFKAPGATSGDVGPPQTIVGAFCGERPQ